MNLELSSLARLVSLSNISSPLSPLLASILEGEAIHIIVLRTVVCQCLIVSSLKLECECLKFVLFQDDLDFYESSEFHIRFVNFFSVLH